MNIIKYLSLFVWSIITLGVAFYMIKQIAFSKGKASDDINLSEAIYLASLIIAIGLVFQRVAQAVSISFDTIQKIQPSQFVGQFIKTGCVISVTGLLIIVLSFFAAKFFISLFFGKRRDAIEFNGDNRSFAIVRGALLVTITVIFLQMTENVFVYIIPSVNVPFYH